MRSEPAPGSALVSYQRVWKSWRYNVGGRMPSPSSRSGVSLQAVMSPPAMAGGGRVRAFYLARGERRWMSVIVFSKLSPEHLITFFFFFEDWTFHSLFL